MTDTGAPAARPPGRLSAWVATHKKEAYGGAAAAAAVGGYAYYKRRQAAAGTSSTSSTATDGTTTPTSTDVAGLTSDGTDLTSEVENWVQDQLNAQNAAVAAQLNNPTTPAAPTPSGPTAPKAGAGLYKIRKGDTLDKISLAVYGNDTMKEITAIRVANPILAAWPRNSKLDWLAGDTIRIPKPPAPATKPPVKKRPPIKNPTKPKPGKKKNPVRTTAAGAVASGSAQFWGG